MGSNLVTDLNRLSIICPTLSDEWNYDKNILKPSDVAVNCTRKMWWKCSKCGFEWESMVVRRYAYIRNNSSLKKINNGSACPKCFSFVTKYPHLLKYWDYEKNNINPLEAVHVYSKKYWWKCTICGHSQLDTITKMCRIDMSRINVLCVYCRSIHAKYPEISEEFNIEKNKITSDQISYGSPKKVWWKCRTCDFEWKATVASRTIGGNGCPKCKTVVLKDGTICSSKVEAFWYLKFKERGVNFLHNLKYSDEMGNRRYDFFFPDENKYVEVSSYHKKSINIKDGYFSYLRNIVKKKRYVEDVLKAKFEFLNCRLNNSDYKFVRNNIDMEYRRAQSKEN